MTDQEFNTFLHARLNKIISTLESKKAEYARTGRMHNFERAAEILRCSPERALMGIAVKHIVSVLDIVDTIDAKAVNPIEIPFIDLWNEKMGDAINYMVLLDVMVQAKTEKL